MDDSNFGILYEQDKAMSDLNNQSTIFLFHKCKSQFLERVSIRNAKYKGGVCIPQNFLIIFFQNTSSKLIWFRSNLTQENIEMLTKE